MTDPPRDSQWAHQDLVEVWPLLQSHTPTFSSSNPLLYLPLSTCLQLSIFLGTLSFVALSVNVLPELTHLPHKVSNMWAFNYSLCLMTSTDKNGGEFCAVLTLYELHSLVRRGHRLDHFKSAHGGGGQH